MSTCKYPSRGAYIRDAVTGTYTPYRVGSQNEERFWKMTPPGQSGEAPKCFYVSPESYEKDHKCCVSDTEKRLWHVIQQTFNRLEEEKRSSK